MTFGPPQQSYLTEEDNEQAMSKVVVQEFVTLDGVVQDPGNEGNFEYRGWQIPFIDDDQIAAIAAQAQAADTLLLGRVTYQTFMRAWPRMKGLHGLAERMNTMPKLVASTTITDMEWNATLIDGDVIEAVSARKQNGGGDCLVLGSISLVQSLIRHGLVDELRMWVAPVVLGGGRRLFDDTTGKIPLTLVGSKTTGSGIAVLTYERDGR
jgi:dihydrofolate reductase